MPYYKYEPQSVLENPTYKLHFERSIITDGTAHNSKSDTVILDKTIKEAYLIDVATPHRHNLHSTITEILQTYTDLKEELQNYGN
jgi:hypothetical protein